MKPTCKRIHLGPVLDGSDICQCCGNPMNADERLVYWKIQVQVRRIIYEVNVKLLEYLRKPIVP